MAGWRHYVCHNAFIQDGDARGAMGTGGTGITGIIETTRENLCTLEDLFLLGIWASHWFLHTPAELKLQSTAQLLWPVAIWCLFDTELMLKMGVE